MLKITYAIFKKMAIYGCIDGFSLRNFVQTRAIKILMEILYEQMFIKWIFCERSLQKETKIREFLKVEKKMGN